MSISYCASIIHILEPAPPWWIGVDDRLNAYVSGCRIATPEGFLSARGSPEALTWESILVPLLALIKRSAPFPLCSSSFHLVIPSIFTRPLFSPSLVLYRNFSWSSSDWLWFVVKCHTTPLRRPSLRLTPRLRRTMYLHATITIGGTKRWTRSVGVRVFTRTRQNHRWIGWKVCEESTRNAPSFTLYRFIYSSASLSRYCKVVNIDPYHTLKKSSAGRINNFFHWVCNEYTVRKVSSVTTYWHQLSQVYIKYKGRRISPLMLKKVYEVRCYRYKSSKQV